MKISYLDLLMLLRENKHPKRIKLYLCGKSAIYFFSDEDSCYLIEEQNEEKQLFCNYLRECLTDKGCLDKNIKIIS